MVDHVLRSPIVNRHVQGINDKLGAHCVAIDQPTTRRLKTLRTTARNRNPDQVGTYVMSATHN